MIRVLGFCQLLVFSSIVCSTKPPNFVLILSDDQDIYLGGMSPMLKTKRFLGKYGTTFQNAYATTPICCPSRASILTGLYLHNHKTFNNSISGGCNSDLWQSTFEYETFAKYLKRAGYNTMYAGKYLNTYGSHNAKGVQHVPPGWDWWMGLVGNSKYYNYTLSVNGTAVYHGDSYTDDYLTDVIKRNGLDFLRFRGNENDPFFMVLSTPAAHAPFTPAPQYQGVFNNTSAPRLPNFNRQSLNKHWMLRMPPPILSSQTLHLMDDIYRRRLETLLSVDDLVAEIIEQLETLDVLENTYIIYTSDHGYHIGQFGLPWDKRQPYEFDLKIPLLMRGPGIPKNEVVNVPVLTIDLAPTILTLANIPVPAKIDGKSFVLNNKSVISSNIELKKHRTRTFLTEYRGEGNMHSNSPSCLSATDNTLAECSSEAECKCQDAINNTYNCLRHISKQCDFQYCEFIDSENFKEFYDLAYDPYQIHNIAQSINETLYTHFHKLLKYLSKCKGQSCSDIQTTRSMSFGR